MHIHQKASQILNLDYFNK